MYYRICVMALLAILFSRCSKSDKPMEEVSTFEKIHYFENLTPEVTGVDFKNEIVETPEINIFNYMYFYNGGGVAAGDLNNDGLQDLYFTSNQFANRLFLNKGNLTFDDITEISGTAGPQGWCTGVTMVDINQDGYLDIYVNYVGDYLSIKGHNRLFLNLGTNDDGIPSFKEASKEYGLDLVGFGTQSAFFDFDLDGDLDMFQLNHSLHQNGTFGRSKRRTEKHDLSGDRLFRNNEGSFVEITNESGIYSSVLGYGLGLAIGDVNNDGKPDIYVGNDFHENDYLYLNLGNGKFAETLQLSMRHTSRFSMGVDIADFNNDLNSDIMTLDMLPFDPKILKASAAEDPFDVFQFKLNFGYNHQYARNNLQMNLGNGNFSDIALYSGVAATDWSWSTLLFDFNLDGAKDIFITNGIKRRSNDLDYINFITRDSIQYKIKGKLTEAELDLITHMPEIKLKNSFFLNNLDSTFSAIEGVSALPKSYSNGAAYVDLDNDGDQELVVNNVEDYAHIYKNLSIENGASSLSLAFKGPHYNKWSVGVKAILYANGAVQMQEYYPTRGYQSSMHGNMIFGLGAKPRVDSLKVFWPDGLSKTYYDISLDSVNVINYNDSGSVEEFKEAQPTMLKQVSIPGLDFTHEENMFVEFNREALIPHMVSADGPALAVGDINGDGLEDVFVGGSKWQSSKLFVQNSKGFELYTNIPLAEDSVAEDIDAKIFDYDNDGDNDLLVLSGGNEFDGNHESRLVRLYRNSNNAYFEHDLSFPKIFTTGADLEIFDFDNDQDHDIVILGRAVPWNYGQFPTNYLLINEGNGFFKDRTSELARDLKNLGMTRKVHSADFNGDDKTDLAILGDWMSLNIFWNRGDKFEREEINPSIKGFWSALSSVDYDQDGDLDLVVGGYGLNSKLTATVDRPISMLINDFDDNNDQDHLLLHYIGDKEYLFHTKDELVSQMPFLKKKVLSYTQFSEQNWSDLFDEKKIKQAKKLTVTETRSLIYINDGAGVFGIDVLPSAVQLAPINAILVDDINNDNLTDIIIGGNQYETNIQMGRYDALYGDILLGAEGKLNVIKQRNTGLDLKGQVRAIESLEFKNKTIYIFGMNNDHIKFYELNN
ncbi:MAG: VCBS repeat-containing protein [Bacteroidota bacterium]